MENSATAVLPEKETNPKAEESNPTAKPHTIDTSPPVSPPASPPGSPEASPGKKKRKGKKKKGGKAEQPESQAAVQVEAGGAFRPPSPLRTSDPDVPDVPDVPDGEAYEALMGEKDELLKTLEAKEIKISRFEEDLEASRAGAEETERLMEGLMAKVEDSLTLALNL